MDIEDIKDKEYLVIHYGGSDLNNEPFEIANITILDAKTREKKIFRRQANVSEELLVEKFLRELEGNKLPIITWNMKDSTYGIDHIINRSLELGNPEIQIDKSLFIDLDRILELKYGTNEYVEHKKLSNLARLNDIHLQGFLEGSEEVKKFDEGNYRAIEVSCNRKVGIIAEIFERYRNDILIVKKPNAGESINLEEYLQPFLKSVIEGNVPAINEELISLLRITHNENQWLEKKREYNLSSEDEWIELFLDILSASNSTTNKLIGIFIGIDDETGKFYDVKLPDETIIRDRVNSVIDPEVNFVLQSIKLPDGKNGFVIAIKPDKNIYSFKRVLKSTKRKQIEKGDIWIRNGSGKDEVAKSKMNNLFQKKLEIFQK